MSTWANNYREYPLRGHIVQRREVGGIVLAECSYSKRFDIPRHCHHDNGYFCLVLKGGYTEKTGKAQRELLPSTLIAHPPGASHSDHFHAAETRLFNVWFGTGWLDRIRDKVNLTDSYLKIGPLNYLSVKLYQEFWQEDIFSPLVIEGLVLEMLGESSRATTKARQFQRPRWLGSATDLLCSTLDQKVTVTRLARIFGVSEIHVARTFRRHFGCTMGEYLRRLRIERATQRLISSDEPITEIANSCGFTDQSHFTRTFKKVTGTPPARYRAAFRP